MPQAWLKVSSSACVARLKPELASLLRRLVASLALWIGVLGVASPALACAATAAVERDCCPEGMPAPCNGGGAGEFGEPVCCVSAPASSQVAAQVCSRSQHAREPDSGPPDPFILSAWFEAFSGNGSAPLYIAPEWSSHRADAALTYLHTGRLRL